VDVVEITAVLRIDGSFSDVLPVEIPEATRKQEEFGVGRGSGGDDWDPGRQFVAVVTN